MNSTNPYIYVCTISKFNLPEFEACLLHKPAHIVLIVSNHNDAQQGAEKLTSLLNVELPQSQIHQPPTRYNNINLGGDDIAECITWVNHVLEPLILNIESSADLSIKPLQRYLNTTGGTKAMLLALITNLKWNKLDYKPIQQQALQCISPQLEQLPNTKALKSSTDIPLNDASPINVARLYATSIHEDKLNPICTKDNSASVAKVIWNGLSNNDPVLMPFYINLNRLWSDQRTQHKTDQIHMSWDDFNSLPTNDNEPSQQNNHDLFTFLELLQQLEPKGLSYTQQELVIPGNAAKKHRQHLKRWICADWLEQLVFHWLVDAGIPQRAIARNLRSGDSSHSSSQREADLFIHHNARSSIIEVKADLPEGKDLKDLEQQLTSLGDRFGRTQKILFIGPHLSQKLHNPAKLESFQLRCLASGVKLCQTPDELLACFGYA